MPRPAFDLAGGGERCRRARRRSRKIRDAARGRDLFGIYAAGGIYTDLPTRSGLFFSRFTSFGASCTPRTERLRRTRGFRNGAPAHSRKWTLEQSRFSRRAASPGRSGLSRFRRSPTFSGCYRLGASGCARTIATAAHDRRGRAPRPARALVENSRTASAAGSKRRFPAADAVPPSSGGAYANVASPRSARSTVCRPRCSKRIRSSLGVVAGRGRVRPRVATLDDLTWQRCVFNYPIASLSHDGRRFFTSGRDGARRPARVIASTRRSTACSHRLTARARVDRRSETYSQRSTATTRLTGA